MMKIAVSLDLNYDNSIVTVEKLNTTYPELAFCVFGTGTSL